MRQFIFCLCFFAFTTIKATSDMEVDSRYTSGPLDIEEAKDLFDQMELKEMVRYGASSRKARNQLLQYAPGFGFHRQIIETCSEVIANQIFKQIYTKDVSYHIPVRALSENGRECLQTLQQFCQSNDQGHLKMDKLGPITVAISKPHDFQALSIIQKDCPLNIRTFLDSQYNHQHGFPFNYMYPEFVESMISFLATENSRLSSFDMSNVLMPLQEFNKIARALRYSRLLKTIAFFHVEIMRNTPVSNPQAMESFLLNLNNNPNSIHPQNLYFDDPTMFQIIADMMQTPGNQIKTLSFSSMRMLSSAMEPLFDALQSLHNQVSSLTISDGLTLDLHPLIYSLRSPNCRITSLDLSGMKIDDHDVDSIVKVLELPHSAKISVLKLSANDFSDEGVRKISTFLLHPNNQIKELDIYDNIFEIEPLNHLKGVLSHPNCKLKKLWISLQHVIDEPGALILLRFMFPYNSVDYLPAAHTAIMISAVIDPTSVLAMIDSNFESRNLSIEDETVFNEDDQRAYLALHTIESFKRSVSSIPDFTLIIDDH